MNRIVAALCAAAVLAASPAIAQQAALERLTSLERALDMSFDADHAHAIVAELDTLWRWPGNEPYQRAISIVERELRDAGYVAQQDAPPEARLVYRIEHRENRAWEPIDASLIIVGSDTPLLEFRTNRNMIAINSASTPEGGVEAELVSLIDLPRQRIDELDLTGKIIMGDMPAAVLARIARRRGAIGALAYDIPDFNKPQTHRDSIPFSGIRPDDDAPTWAINLSHRARAALLDASRRGPVRIRVNIAARSYPGDDQTLIAEVRGSRNPKQRIVLSAHVQEPGANDNASGVACQAEMARVIARTLASGAIDPHRTITMLWGDEINAVARYLDADEARTDNIIFGVSLDMVGQDTSKTGGSFLIEKLPDPSAAWTRGNDKHTEWWGDEDGRVATDDFVPHYLTDFMLGRCNARAAQHRDWAVSTNPFEGGSDHVPFLTHRVPSVLLWHFTDVYYHTDGDRIENVSRDTLKNVGASALAAVLSAASADTDDAMLFGGEVVLGAVRRLEAEIALSTAAVNAGSDPAEQRRIIDAWLRWYIDALQSVESLPVDGPDARLSAWLRQMGERIREVHLKYMQEFDMAEARYNERRKPPVTP